MIKGFTFERALSWPFSAPHVATFPWIFGLAYALVFSAAVGLIGFLAAGDIGEWMTAIEAAEGNPDPDVGLSAVFGGFTQVLPWAVLGGIVSWMIWAMFETASQRRYVFGLPFSLGFGADELRMMVVGLLWNLVGFVLIAIPALLIMGSAFAAMFAGAEGLSEEEIGRQIIGPVFGALGLSFLIFPLYVFFATRLAPCFGLTVRERKIRFFDAWNVSRGRFWSILGAYIILAFGGAVVQQVLGAILQVLLLPAAFSLADAAEAGEDAAAVFLSPGFLVPAGAYLFAVLFLQGVLQHVVGGPAAFAVRHDPRGGVDEETQVEAFI